MADLTNLLNLGASSKDVTRYSINNFEYYSGSQVTIWFGNILLDDINSIQWQRVQNKRPIYGYASQNFDAVAKGTVIISGNFVINFRQSGYLPLLMNQIAQIYNEVEDKANWPELRKIIGLHLKNGTFGPQTSQEIIDLGNNPNFLNLAQAYEDSIWGGGVPGDPDGATIVTPTPADVVQHDMIKDGFNILVTYGNTSLNDAKTLNDYIQSTTKSIVGVHLVGESQIIQVGGQPVLEQYEFIARDSNRNISSSR